jgi:Iap family predicted aminopeptidase
VHTDTHTLVTLTAKMIEHEDLKHKVKEHLRPVLEKDLESELKSFNLKTSDGRIKTWKALAVDFKVELFDAVLESWEKSRNTLLASQANDVETAHKIKGLMEDDYARWRNNWSAKERSKKCTSALLCPTGSRTNDQPAKSSSASAESGTAEPGPEGE